jgi:polyisoprenoid-binding protein YceI
MAEWVLDPDHSVASFAIRHMMVAFVRGQFNKLSGTIRLDPEEPARSSFEATIEVGSLLTGVKKRDLDLLGGNFFDSARFPSITFRSTAVEPTGANRPRVTGDLTIRGITRPVVLDAEYSGPVESPYGETTMGFEATARVNREDFGITWNVQMEKGGVMVGREVRIALDLEGDLLTEE